MPLLEVDNGIHGQSGFKAVWFCDKQVSIIRNVWCHGGSWLLFPVSNVILSSHVLLGHPPSSSPSFIRICCFSHAISFPFAFHIVMTKCINNLNHLDFLASEPDVVLPCDILLLRLMFVLQACAGPRLDHLKISSASFLPFFLNLYILELLQQSFLEV